MARAREGLVELVAVAVVRPCPVHANVCVGKEVMRLCSHLVRATCCVGLTREAGTGSLMMMRRRVWRSCRTLCGNNNVVHVSSRPSLRDLGVLTSLQDLHTG